MHSLLSPVIGLQPVILVIVSNHITQSCVRVNLTVLTNEVLTIGYVVNLVNQTTTRHRTYDSFVSLEVSLCGRATIVDVVVLKSLVVLLVVSCWILDVVVILYTT